MYTILHRYAQKTKHFQTNNIRPKWDVIRLQNALILFNSVVIMIWGYGFSNSKIMVENIFFN